MKPGNNTCFIWAQYLHETSILDLLNRNHLPSPPRSPLSKPELQVQPLPAPRKGQRDFIASCGDLLKVSLDTQLLTLPSWLLLDGKTAFFAKCLLVNANTALRDPLHSWPFADKLPSHQNSLHGLSPLLSQHKDILFFKEPPSASSLLVTESVRVAVLTHLRSKRPPTADKSNEFGHCINHLYCPQKNSSRHKQVFNQVFS